MMMKRTIPLLMLASLGVGPIGPVAAQSVDSFSAENLRDACDSLVLAVRGISPIAQDDPGAMLCLGFIAGWTQAMDANPDKAFCLPPADSSPPGDLADLIVSFVDSHPDRRKIPAHEILLEAFEDAFPCPIERAEDPE